jgi:hypothetical protein
MADLVSCNRIVSLLLVALLLPFAVSPASSQPTGRAQLVGTLDPPQTLGNSHPVTLYGFVENQGDAASQVTTWGLREAGNTLATFAIPALEPGETRQVQANVTPTTMHRYTLAPDGAGASGHTWLEVSALGKARAAVLPDGHATDFGSTQTVLLTDRPMHVTVLAVPDDTPVYQTNTNANGTFTHTAARVSDSLRVEFNDGDHHGQDVWYSAAWLESLGIENPVFKHADGTEVRSERKGSHFLVHAGHFSEIHTFAGSSDNFVKFADQTYSDVAWYSGRMRVVSDRRDTKDESFARDFTRPAEYILKSTLNMQTQGNWQGGYPLAIGNLNDRLNQPVTAQFGAPGSIGFFYYSHDWNLRQRPQVEAYYMSTTGTKTIVWTWDTAASCQSATNPNEGWTVGLRLRVTRLLTYWELTDNCGVQQRTGSASNSLLPMSSLDGIFVGSESLNQDSYELPTTFFVDDVSLEVVRASLYNAPFASTSTGWTTTGNAACCTNNALGLTTNNVNQVGRALATGGSTATRFSAEFEFRTQPGGSGADGMTFMFYKNTAYTPAGGRELGFNDGTEPSNVGHEGYGIVLDTYYTSEYGDLSVPSIALVKDHVKSRIIGAGPFAYNDGKWHTMGVELVDNRIGIFYDGQYILGIQPVTFSRTYGGLGFSASTGGIAEGHQVRNFRFSTQVTATCSDTTDPDGDGLVGCQEQALGTSNVAGQTDSDQDGIGQVGTQYSDYVESPYWYPNRDAVFCKTPYSPTTCEYADPARKDVYVEADYMVKPTVGAVGGYSMQLTSAEVSPIVTAFARRDIELHMDAGIVGYNLGGANQVTYNAAITFGVRVPGAPDFYDYKNGGDGITANFNAARYRIFHYLLIGQAYTDVPGSSGVAWAGDDDFFISYGAIRDNQAGYNIPAGGFDTAISGTTIHELGHNLCLTRNAYNPATCSYATGIDTNGPTQYVSSMNYRYQMFMVDYSTGVNGSPNDHNDWGSIRPQDMNSGNDLTAGAPVGPGVTDGDAYTPAHALVYGALASQGM